MTKRFPEQSDVPKGFRFSAASSGIKKTGGLDLALMTSDVPASAAAVFTTNLVKAAPVLVSQAHLKRAAQRMRAILVNSGNANCCTGENGMRAVRRASQALARQLGCAPEQVLVNSTGVIGVPLPEQRILDAIPAITSSLDSSAKSFSKVTQAIMTTDTRPKWASARMRIGGKVVRLLGCAKGAGMIHPNMATMLAFVVTDAAISPTLLQRALREVVGRTFNCISIDGDTSTNDTLAVLANGASGIELSRHSPLPTRHVLRFVEALEQVCRSLALQIVADGEGAQRLVQIQVSGARNEHDAKQIANTLATSPLVKTALAGADPNWGRILAAAGRSGVRFYPARTRIWLAGIPVFRNGVPLPFDEKRAHRAMLAKHVSIVLDLGMKKETRYSKLETRRRARLSRFAPHPSATVWTCDFTQEYVTVNASYRT
jgi:glutamate N-acetyltransferase/amino-acid N-acetyltransferase